jgi:predicted small secreted protein
MRKSKIFCLLNSGRFKMKKFILFSFLATLLFTFFVSAANTMNRAGNGPYNVEADLSEGSGCPIISKI